MTNYNSVFASHITAMLELRDSLGLYTGPLPFVMQNFDRFCLEKYPDTTALTRELATQWCDEGKSAGRSGYKMHAIRSFGKYLQSVGADAFVMPSAWIGKPARRLPHMFTDDELERFFNACDRIGPSKLSPYREHIIPVVFRLMLGCGLRPQEARRLRRADVDLDTMVLTIVHGKRRKNRLVPVGDDMTELLARFDRLADLRQSDREWFFEQTPGQPYGPRWLTAQYHCVRAIADGVAPGSTPYTLRHNYATRTLARWVDEGRDLGVWLPYLSAYMGHATYTATAYYVHLLPHRIAATGLTSADGIIPEPPL
ncbi:tyrosine-type recombinase/integrase [Rhodococcus opacus]|nr:tyrosine-type recombinase/integrase [Rhodococcus opacus]